MDWILYPVFQCGLEAAGIGLCVYLFLNLKREARDVYLSQEKRHQTLQAAVDNLRSEVVALQAAVQETEQRAGMLVPPQPPQSGLNVNKRTQALRMYKSGEDAQAIARRLAIPEREVDLLIKVQRILLDATDAAERP
jgi:DNA-binding NarL/FixJ family response regulator